MKATRRGVLAGTLAVPAMAGLPAAARARTGGTVLVHDPSLAAGRALAGAGDTDAMAITGDRIRFARTVFARRPALVVGLSRSADALLFEDVAREAGYRPVAAPASLGRFGWALAPR